MTLSRAWLGLTVIVAGCGRSISSNAPTLGDASSSSTVSAATPPSCDRMSGQVLEMDVTPVPADLQQYAWLGKFALHVSGCGFRIGAMTWDMQIGDEYSFNGSNGNETDITWSLEKEPAIGDELFMGYGNSKGGTGIHYEGLGKISVPSSAHVAP